MKKTLLLLSLLFLSACASNKKHKAEIPPPADTITPAVASIGVSTDIITDKAGVIEETFPQAKFETTAIKTEASKIDSAASEIAKANQDYQRYTAAELAIKQQGIVALEKEKDRLIVENDKLNNALTKANEDSNKWLKKFTAVTIFAGGIGMAVTFALFFMGRIREISIPILCGAVLIGALTLQFMLQYIFWIGLAVTVILVALIAYRVWTNQRTIKENAVLLENIKKVFEFDENDNKRFEQLANDIQSPSTRETMKRAREVLGLNDEQQKS